MTPDQRLACYRLAVVVMEARLPTMQELLLLETAFFGNSEVVGHLRSQLEEPEVETAAWLAALAGDQQLFELAWAQCQPQLEPEPSVMLDANGQEISVSWRPGMQGFWDYTASLCRPPLTTAALDFLYPRYYDGPLYTVLPELVLSVNEAWMARVVADYQYNPQLLLEILPDQEVIVPQSKRYHLRIAVMVTCQRGSLEGLKALLPLIEPAQSADYTFRNATLIRSVVSAGHELVKLFLETLPSYADQVLCMVAAGRNLLGYPCEIDQHILELALEQLQPDRCPLSPPQLREVFFVLVARQRFSETLGLLELYQAPSEVMNFSECVQGQMLPWPTREADFQRLLAEAAARGWTDRLEALRVGLTPPIFWQII